MAWLRTSVSSTNVSGLSSTSTAIQVRVGPLSVNISPGGVVVSMPTISPTKIGIMASTMEPSATIAMRTR